MQRSRRVQKVMIRLKWLVAKEGTTRVELRKKSDANQLSCVGVWFNDFAGRWSHLIVRTINGLTYFESPENSIVGKWVDRRHAPSALDRCERFTRCKLKHRVLFMLCKHFNRKETRKDSLGHQRWIMNGNESLKNTRGWEKFGWKEN